MDAAVWILLAGLAIAVTALVILMWRLEDRTQERDSAERGYKRSIAHADRISQRSFDDAVAWNRLSALAAQTIASNHDFVRAQFGEAVLDEMMRATPTDTSFPDNPYYAPGPPPVSIGYAPIAGVDPQVFADSLVVGRGFVHGQSDRGSQRASGASGDVPETPQQ